MGAYTRMGAYKRDVRVVMQMSAYVRRVLIFYRGLFIPILR